MTIHSYSQTEHHIVNIIATSPPTQKHPRTDQAITQHSLSCSPRLPTVSPGSISLLDERIHMVLAERADEVFANLLPELIGS